VSNTPRNDAGEFSDAWDDHGQIAAVAGLGVSNIVPVEIRIPGLDGLPSFDLSVSYRDVAEKRMATAKYLVSDGGQHVNLAITTG
jgi:hypothetical protein